MIPFAAPVDDIFLSLHAMAGIAPLDNWDGDLSEAITRHFASFAQGVLAPLNAPGDQQGAQLENGRVRMPDGFAEAYRALAQGGWQGLRAPERFGGQAMDALAAAAVSEIFTGANHALQMVTSLVPGAISTLIAHGNEAQQETYIPRLASGDWLSTMCLTEPQAGSDLSTTRTIATEDREGWRITGEKIFISGGDQNLSRGILHLVLARTGATEDGVRGLSLFLCPSHFDGARNSVTVTRIEEKMGLHASPTCQLAFEGARAELIGVEGGGLKAMFTMMNHARLDVALQGVAHAARASQIAQAYADERRQGRKPDGSPARLSDHADVRRMLDEQCLLTHGSRAMCHIALITLERGDRPALVDVLTPLCKLFATDAGIRAADLGIQILGGYGYLEEYGLSQIWRDARITSIYEGTNGIQALTLANRVLRRDGSTEAFARLVLDLGGDTLVGPSEAWKSECAHVVKLDDPSPLAHDFAQKTARLLLAAVWQRLAVAATGTARANEFARLRDQALAKLV